MELKQDILLSDYSDELHNNFLDDLAIWSSNIVVSNNVIPRAKSFSTMISSSFLHLYDHPDLIEKYPSGFYSENSAYIPTYMYETMQNYEPLSLSEDSSNKNWNFTGLMLIPIFTQMIEKKYDISFSEKEKEEILIKSLEFSFSRTKLTEQQKSNMELYLSYQDKNEKEKNKLIDKWYAQGKNEVTENYFSLEQNKFKEYVKTIFNIGKLEFIPHENIITLFENIGIGENTLNFVKQLTNDNNFIDYALLKNNDMYEKGHPFNRLIEKVRNPKTFDLSNYDVESAKKVVNNLAPTQFYILYNSFEKFSQKIVQESNNVEELINNISGTWAQVALETTDMSFKKLVQILVENISVKYQDKNKSLPFNTEVMFQVAKTINNNNKCSKGKQTIIIDEVSGSTAMKESIRITTNKHQSKIILH